MFLLAVLGVAVFVQSARAEQYNLVCIYNNTKEAASRLYFKKVKFTYRWCNDEDCSSWKKSSVGLTQRVRSSVPVRNCKEGCYFNIRYHVKGDSYKRYKAGHMVTSNKKRCTNRNSHYFGMRGDTLELWKGKP